MVSIMTQSFEAAQAYVLALTGDANAVLDWRCIHDTDKAVPAHNYRGTLTEVWQTLVRYNQNGYGIFACMNAMDGYGRELANVQFIRAHAADLDNPLTSHDSYNRANATHPQPHLAVQTSPNKLHIYWMVEPYTSNEYFTLQQRKLAQLYDGDKKIIDPTRVLRIPGFYHLKAEPFLVSSWPLSNAPRWTAAQIGDSLQHINIINHIGVRSPLGDPDMAAPSLDWLRFAISLLNPNDLDRNEWLATSAAFKQAGSTLADPESLFHMWQEWCARYTGADGNDLGENQKLWHSIRETEVGWAHFERRTVVKAYLMFPNPPKAVDGMVAQSGQARVVGGGNEVVGSNPTHPTSADLPELLSAEECAVWFRDCYFIARTGEIFSPAGRYMTSSQFNGLYGGKHFIITSGGKSTDEAWKAALRSTVYCIPKVDHVRFLPGEAPFAVIKDRMGRKGLNTYIPIQYDAKEGDVSLFLKHVEKILPDANDRKILMDYMAHNIKYPGYKIAWAPLVQSTEGVGKTVFFEVMQHALGEMYVYRPKAQELVNSGSKFNAWMRGKLCILVDEIKIDERRELIEILKPMISDLKVEVQAKGVDQEMEDNPANWIFFSNYKDAIPVNKNGRRYAIFFSAIQSRNDLLAAGMDKNYFDVLWKWLRDEGGLQAITYYLLNYPIERGAIWATAPETSSHDEAIRISRSPMQVAVEEAIQDNMQGFRGGYVSSIAVTRRMHALGVKSPSGHSIRTMLESMGYVELGRSATCYPFEDASAKPILYANDMNHTLQGYSMAQGYDLFSSL